MTFDIRVPSRHHNPGYLLPVEMLSDSMRHPRRRGPKPKPFEALSESGKMKRLRKLRLQQQDRERFG